MDTLINELILRILEKWIELQKNISSLRIYQCYQWALLLLSIYYVLVYNKESIVGKP